MRENAVTHALCISVELAAWPAVRRDRACARQPLRDRRRSSRLPRTPRTRRVDDLVAKAATPKVVAIGETGLDYYRLEGDLEWQRERFRRHIRAARATGKPLVIHTRAAADDTLAIMREEGAAEAGGVMHCFTETWDVAQGRARPRLSHLVLGHRHVQERGRAQGRRASRSARPHADRDRQPVPRAGAASRQAQPAGVRALRRRGDRTAARRSTSRPSRSTPPTTSFDSSGFPPMRKLAASARSCPRCRFAVACRHVRGLHRRRQQRPRRRR